MKFEVSDLYGVLKEPDLTGKAIVWPLLHLGILGPTVSVCSPKHQEKLRLEGHGPIELFGQCHVGL